MRKSFLNRSDLLCYAMTGFAAFKERNVLLFWGTKVLSYLFLMLFSLYVLFKREESLFLCSFLVTLSATDVVF